MSMESMKRVLMATKGKAREMRKGKLESRMSPVEEPVEAPAEMPEEMLAEPEEMAEAPEMMTEAAPSDAPPSEEEKAAAIQAIRDLLARV